MFLLSFLLTFNKCTLKQVKSVVLIFLNVIFTLVPFSYFLFNHQFTSKSKTSFIWCGWQSIVESSFFSHLVNKIHLEHSRWKARSKFEICNLKYFRDVILVNFIFRTKRVCLSSRFSENSLYLDSLVSRFLLRFLCWFNSFKWNLHDAISITVKRDLNLHLRWDSLQNWYYGSLEVLMSTQN